MKQRIKSHKFGSAYQLRDTDFLIASYFPTGPLVHKVLCIITNDATTERGEWIVSESFDHSFGVVEASALDDMRFTG